MRTTIKTDGQGVRVIRDDGQTILLDDVGRCYRIYGPGKNQSIDVSHNIGDWAKFVRTARYWFRTDCLPIMDVHA